MNRPVPWRRLAPALLLAAIAPHAEAHVVVSADDPVAGSTVRARFVVGHACAGSQATTELRVRLPAGFVFLSAEAPAGWSVDAKAEASRETNREGTSEVTWKADAAVAAAPGAARPVFTIVGRLPDLPGTLWFRALQTCDAGQSDWATVPDAATPKPPFPAPRLEVRAPAAPSAPASAARQAPADGAREGEPRAYRAVDAAPVSAAATAAFGVFSTLNFLRSIAR